MEKTKSLEQERDDSINDISDLLSKADYDLDGLLDIESPDILVMGSGIYMPEAHVLKKWAEKNKKLVNVVCVDKDMPDSDFRDALLHIQDSEYFKLKNVKSTFEEFDFEQTYDLILLLRQKSLVYIENKVYGKIPKALSENGTFIMSGGYDNRFKGTSLSQNGFNLELKKPIITSWSDYYGQYPGENTIFKFKKYESGI